MTEVFVLATKTKAIGSRSPAAASVPLSLEQMPVVASVLANAGNQHTSSNIVREIVANLNVVVPVVGSFANTKITNPE